MHATSPRRHRYSGCCFRTNAISCFVLPLENVPESLPEVDIKHRSKAVDAILVKAILEGAKLDLRAGVALESHCFGEVCGTKDMRIGVDNFLTNGPRAKAAFVHA